MSVQTEINRLSSAKTAIASAITAKGVSVPSTTKIDGMAALIESIPTGGLPSVITPGDTPVLWAEKGMGITAQGGGQDISVSMTISKSGTYRIKYWAIFTATAMSSSPKMELRKNNTAVTGGTITNGGQVARQCSLDMTLTAGDVLSLRGYGSAEYNYSTGATTIYYAIGGGLVACANV
ncbi:MAG: hypothetical protein J6V15_02125 [Clostridia bacterium]|nr:hypothetical protein [Clostridia bacterium]